MKLWETVVVSCAVAYTVYIGRSGGGERRSRWRLLLPYHSVPRGSVSRSVTSHRTAAATAVGSGHRGRVEGGTWAPDGPPANGVSDRFFNSPLPVDWRRPRSDIFLSYICTPYNINIKIIFYISDETPL
jgi:hypothetical protein